MLSMLKRNGTFYSRLRVPVPDPSALRLHIGEVGDEEIQETERT
jgi:hypothetical protein